MGVVRVRWLAVLATAILVVAACGSEGTGGTAGTSTQPATSVATTAAPTPSPTAAAPAFKPISIKGSGDKVVKFTIPDTSPAIATFTNTGGANFIVESLASDGSENDVLVNVIGAYKGTVLFDAQSGEHSVAFKIQSTKAWTATIAPVTSARAWGGTTVLKGTGDDAVRISPASSGLVVLAVTHTGQANFIVTGYSDAGADLMVNEIGKYSGQVQLADGSYFLTVQADGAWTVTPQQ